MRREAMRVEGKRRWRAVAWSSVTLRERAKRAGAAGGGGGMERERPGGDKELRRVVGEDRKGMRGGGESGDAQRRRARMKEYKG
jgi:hypothetical protein